ncbi:hypothetical protein ACQKQC_22210 [Vibrio fortis]|uniref:hypothetical protein n=1 Tax=Vibrio fortis TaxID=212667 RepID=UPI0040695ED0
MRQHKILLFATALSCMAISLPVTASDKVFNKVCQSCHTGGLRAIFTGAPNINDKSEWQPFLHQRKTPTWLCFGQFFLAQRI